MFRSNKIIYPFSRLLLIFSFCIFFSNCTDEEHDPDQDFFTAVVLGEDIDCKSVYDIQLTEWAHGFSDSTSDNTFRALGLPEHLKDSGIEIQVRLRLPTPDEQLNCSNLGPTYLQVVVEEAFKN